MHYEKDQKLTVSSQQVKSEDTSKDEPVATSTEDKTIDAEERLRRLKGIHVIGVVKIMILEVLTSGSFRNF